MVLIPRNYPELTSRRVHTAQWVDGEKLSQSTAGDVGSLVNLGVITYLTQLLDTGFFHGAWVCMCVWVGGIHMKYNRSFEKMHRGNTCL